MKIKAIFLALCLTCTAFAEQRLVVVNCVDGKANTAELAALLRQGWSVITATPVLDSDSISMGSHPKQGYTVTIVYVIEKKP